MKPNKKTLSKDTVFFRLEFNEIPLLVQLATLYEKLGGLLIRMSLVQVQ